LGWLGSQLDGVWAPGSSTPQAFEVNVKLRPVLPILVVAVLHLSLTGVSLLGSLYFLVPGEPGFDPNAAQRAALLSRLTNLLGFPVLPVLLLSPASPLSDGPMAWLWLGVNSLLWAMAIVLLVRSLLRLLSPRRLGDRNAV
jgi:hypothetical protein